MDVFLILISSFSEIKIIDLQKQIRTEYRVRNETMSNYTHNIYKL